MGSEDAAAPPAAGEEFAFTFTRPGEYSYLCRPHRLMGTTGTVVVQ
jgi:plastocyanin